MEFFFGFYEKINEAVIKRCHELYGDTLPKEVTERLEVEWAVLEERDWAVTLRALTEVKRICNDKGGRFFISGPLESSFIAYLLGISYIDPMPPHYLCPECKHTEFPKDPPALCGPDLPVRLCPSCGTPMLKSGYDIQMEFLFPDRIWPYTEIHCEGSCLSEICRALRDTLGFIPVSKPEYGMLAFEFPGEDTPLINLYEIISLEQESLLCSITGIDPSVIQPDGGEIDSLRIELAAEIKRRRPLIDPILSSAPINCIEDIIHIFGLDLSMMTWESSGEKLLRELMFAPKDTVSSRDDVFNKLVRHGMERDKAYVITSAVRKGRCLHGEHRRWPEWEKEMHEIGIPKWYTESMKEILYLPPRAKCVACAIRAYKAAWIKKHYPEAFSEIISKD